MKLTKEHFRALAESLSLTNLLVVGAFAKVLTSPEVNYAVLGVLFVAIANLAHSRSEAGKIKSKELSIKEEEFKDTIEAMKANTRVLEDRVEACFKYIKANTDSLSALKEQVNDQGKVVEEAKTMLSASKVASSFKRQQL